MASLDRITRANFIPPIRQPHFKVYDYYYNLVVDKLNTMQSSGVTTTVTNGTVSVDNYGDGSNFTTVVTLTGYIVGPLASAGAAKVLIPPSALCSFPAGAHIENYFYFSLSLTAAGTAVVACDTGLGSVAGDGSAYAVLSSASVGITVEDRLTGQTVPTAATGGAITKGMGFHTAGVLTGAVANNTASGTKDVFLNAAATWNANNTGNLTATGTVVLKWAKVSF